MCAAAEVTSFNVLNKSFMIVRSEVISATDDKNIIGQHFFH